MALELEFPYSSDFIHAYVTYAPLMCTLQEFEALYIDDGL